MCRSRGPAGSDPPRFEFGSGWVGRERTISREESAATSAGHSPCLREVNVPDGRRSPLPSPDTVVCQKRVARPLPFCPPPAPATIRYGVPLVTRENPATRSTMGDREVADGRFASTRQNRTAGKALRAARLAAGTEGAAPTQTEFAARLGDGLGLEISAAALSNWESGRRSVPAQSCSRQ